MNASLPFEVANVRCRQVRRRLFDVLRPWILASERNAPPLFGLGLIDDLSDEVLVAAAERESPQIRGRVSRMKSGRIGRFGWKAQTTDLREFVLGACPENWAWNTPAIRRPSRPGPGPQGQGPGSDAGGMRRPRGLYRGDSPPRSGSTTPTSRPSRPADRPSKRSAAPIATARVWGTSRASTATCSCTTWART